jgi:hypothetical protein
MPGTAGAAEFRGVRIGKHGSPGARSPPRKTPRKIRQEAATAIIAIASNAPNMGTITGRRRRLAARADQSVERTGGKRDAQEHEPLIQ